MPKASSTQNQKKASITSTLLVLKHAEKRVLVIRPKSYLLAVDTASRHFPHIPRGAVNFQTNELDICDGHYVDISPETWGDVIDLISSVSIVEAKPHKPSVQPLALSMPTPSPGADEKINVNFDFGTATITLIVKPSMPFGKICDAACRRLGKDACEMRYSYRGYRVHPDETPHTMGLQDGDLIEAFVEQRGGKPVIYLFSPEDVDATVTLSLVPEWRFSVVYPVVPIKHKDNGHEKIRWDIRTHSDGSLAEKITGLDVSYLFWEAHTNSEAPPSPPRSPVLGQSSVAEHFSPTSSDLSDEDSVVLSVDVITPYLDKALAALGLHTEARTSFITYWLPSLLKHKYVALRFLSQSAYERAAPIEVSPKPDVITRIFMLFKGIPEDRVHDWSTARAKAEDGVDWWKDVVGVDLERALDTSLFRVLEWGGMEVLRG